MSLLFPPLPMTPIYHVKKIDYNCLSLQALSHRSDTTQQPLLHPHQYILMLQNLQILRLALEDFIRVLAWLEHCAAAAAAGTHLGHLLGGLGCRCLG